MKDSMFQFATTSKILEDTDLITLGEAQERWEANKEKFIDLHIRGEEPEMCIWINCASNSSYGASIWHVDRESVVNGGEIHNLVRVGG